MQQKRGEKMEDETKTQEAVTKPEEAVIEPEEETIQAEQEEKELAEKGIILPFPNATIVRTMRKHLEQGKQIKGPVKIEMNLWLGKMIERVTKKMNENPYSYVDLGMFREAIETYEKIKDIELEKERIVHQLLSIKAACDVLIEEVDRKFKE